VRIEQRLRRATRGFSYVEILLSLILLAVLLVPALESLQTAILGRPTVAAMPGTLALQSKMEQVLSVPFSKIYAETYVPGGNTKHSVSDTFSDASGTPDRKLVVIYRYNALTKTVSGVDTGLVLVSVYYEAEGPEGALATLAGRWW
jgi:hypothetical protein